MYTQLAALYSKIFPLNGAQVEFVQRALGSQGTLIDLGCGTGELCNALLREGHHCLGIDLDPQMIAHAQGKGFADRFKVMAIENISEVGARFDVAVCLGNVISHLDAKALSDVHAGVRRALNPGGQWICQFINWNKWLRDRVWEFPLIERDAGRLKFRRSYTGDDRTVEFTIQIEIDGQEVHRATTTLHPLSIEQHIEAATKHGFRHGKSLSGWDGHAFDGEKDGSVVLVFEG